jgi:hypothetical protein
MKKLIIFIIILFFYQKTFSQDTASLTKHWVRYSDCSIYYFNNINYNGILLDGKKIYKQFPIISNAIYKITNLRIDSCNFIIVDSSIVIEFENKFSSLSKNNDTILDRKCDDIQKYFRQYLAFIFQDKHYLLAGFTILDKNELNKIISSRWFYFEHHKYFSCKQFYILYNIENKIIDKILYKDPINEFK